MIPKKLLMIGNSGSGKSELIKRFTPRLESLGYSVSFLVDRVGLEGAVLYDAQETHHGFSPNSGTHLVGDGRLSSIVVEYDRKTSLFHNFRTTLKGAEILNEPKGHMIKALSSLPDAGNQCTIAEWATGLRVPQKYLPVGREDLLQDSPSLMQFIRLNNLFKRCLIIETFAPLDDRVKWNNARGEHAIDEAEFRKLFPDGDRMPAREAAALGDNYYFFDNSGTNPARFEQDANMIFCDIIMPRLGIQNLTEGSLPPRARR